MSFLVRRVSLYTSHTNNVRADLKLTIDPSQIIFQNYHLNKVNIVKVIIRNDSGMLINFSIKQPKQQCLKIRYRKTSLSPSESLQIFVFLNSQIGLTSNNDEFVIYVSKEYSIYVPIIIKSAGEQGVRRASLLRQHNSNEKQPDDVEQLRRPSLCKRKITRLDRRKNAALIGKNVDNKIEALIRIFLDRFSRIEQFLRDKAIKNEVFIGEKQMNKQKYHNIISFNLKLEITADEQMKELILSRYFTEFTKQGPSIRTFDKIVLSWNQSKNEPKITFNKGMKKLTEEVRKIVVNYRFKKMHRIMSIYRKLRQDQRIQQPQSMIVNKYPYQSEESRFDIFPSNHSFCEIQQSESQQKKKHDYYCRKIKKLVGNKMEKKLGTDFNQFTLSPKLLECDYESPELKKQNYFEIKPRIGFDNWVSLEQSTVHAHQLMNYRKMEKLPQWECYPFIGRIKNNKIISEENASVFENGKIISIDKQLKAPVLQFYNISNVYICKYKNYDSSYQDDASDAYMRQSEISKIYKDSISAIAQVKYCKQFFMPFFNEPEEKEYEKFLSDFHPSLIYQIKKQDKIDFDAPSNLILRKIQYTKECERSQQLINQADEWTIRPPKRDDSRYEQILANLDKINLKKQNISNCKVASFNKFVKNEKNKIYL